MAKTVVVLGGALAAVPVAHWLLKHVRPTTPDLKVILVAPNTDMYWHFAAVRGIVPGQLPDEKLFYPIEPAFAAYPKGSFEFVNGLAESLDPDSNQVVVNVYPKNTSRTITYDIVYIATGASFKEGVPFKNLKSTPETKAALHRYQEQLAKAQTVVVAGAGTTGVETVGEIAYEYAAASGSSKKEVYLIADQALPLPSNLKQDVRETALRELEKLKVTVIKSTHVTKATSDPATGKTTLELTSTDGTKKVTTLVTDLYIPTFGIIPNTLFLPPRMLDGSGFVKTDSYLRAEGFANVFVAGDASNIESPQGKHTEDQIQVVVKNLQAVIVNGTTATLEEYKPDPKVMIGVTVGRGRGTGQIGNWKPWSILLWYMKGRFLGTDYAADLVAGKRTVANKAW